ncbi:MAG: hypothetical protein M3Z21_07440 [Pseudomonadota bacterium]|nr:hypothetical protein [Pseudomonadota bacterium]
MYTPVLWILLSLLAAYLGRNTTIGFVGFLLLSLLFSPILGLLILLITTSRGRQAPSGRTS